MHRSVYVLFAIVLTSGCANMSAPRHIAAANCQDGRQSSICLLDRIQLEYEAYSTGAAKSQAAVDGVMLASAAVGVVGAAVGSGSDLYKSAGAVGLSSLGFSSYGNFKTQDRVVRDANSRLTCARPELQTLLQASEGNLFVKKDMNSLIGFSTTLSDDQIATLKTEINNSPRQALAKIRNNINLRTNAETADKILKTINSDATKIIMKLQNSVSSQINQNSFDVEKAIKIITTKQKTHTTEESENRSQFINGNGLTPEDVIDTYNSFVKCIAGEEEQNES